MKNINTILVTLIFCIGGVLFYLVSIPTTENNEAETVSSYEDVNLLASLDPNMEMENDDTIASIEKPEQAPIPLAKPPRTKQRDSIATVLSIKSHFLKLGCCEDEEQRLEACCCLDVLDEYKILKEKNDPKLAEYSQTDPILGQCKKVLYKEFNVVDHPPMPVAETDNYDDLF